MPGSVLIIDSDALFAGQAQAALESAGIAVAVRDDAPIDVIRRLRPSVLIVNVELPKGSGYSICNRLRGDKELGQIPILLTSAEASGESFRRHATTATRADDYANKPIETADLMARIGRLMSLAASRQLPAGALEGVAPPGPPEAPRPPPVAPPMATTSGGAPLRAGPPPMPNPAAGLLSVPAPGAPPPLKRPTASLVPEESAWRASTFDEMIRERVAEAAPVAPPKTASADERERYLRAYGKFLETKEKAARAGWDQVHEQGRELDRRFQGMRFELAQRDARIAELTDELTRTQAQLRATDAELKAFQGEITRIFEEKDAEERETIGRLSTLEDNNRALSRDLAESKKQNDADKTRLKLFKQDLDELQAEGAKVSAALQAANDRAIRAEDAHRHAERKLQNVEARLSSAETSAVERSEALEAAQEQLELAAQEAAIERQRVADELTEQFAAREAELTQQIQDLEGTELQLRGDLDAMDIARAELEASLQSVTQERDHLDRVKAELTAALDEQEDQAQEQRAQIEAELARVKQQGAGQTAIVTELKAARDDLDRQLRETQDELLKEQATWTTREAELNETVNELESEIIRLEQDHGAAEKRSAELEASLASAKADAGAGAEELEELRSNLFERIAELDATRSNAQNLQRQVETMRAELGAERAKLALGEAGARELEESRAQVEAELEDVRQRLLDAEAARDAAEDAERSTQAMAEELSKKLDKSEAFVARAKEKIGELQKSSEGALAAAKAEAEEERAREKESRGELEASLAALETELSMREADGADAVRRAMELEQELANLAGRHAAELEAKAQELADRDEELEELRTSTFETQAAAESAEGRIAALLSDVEQRERSAQALRAELSQRDKRLSELGLELVKARDQLRANAELSRERERRDALLGRVMGLLEQVQSSLATAPGNVKAETLTTDAIDVLAALGTITHDAPTRDVSAAWPSTPAPPIDDDATSSGSLRTRPAMPSMRGPFPSMAPLHPTAPIRPDALGHDTALFGTLIHELQSESVSPQRPNQLKPPRRVSVDPPRAETPLKGAKRKARIMKPDGSLRASDPPSLGGGLDEAAMLIESNLPDDPFGPPRPDPFRRGGAALPGAQLPPPPNPAEDLDEREVTEIIHIDRLK